jgi:SAM-dependent methyltransferase
MPAAGELAAARERTRRHYDRHPFGFDQEEILEEKLERRVMGEAIRRTTPASLVVDVGCGASRVARLVRRATRARTLGIDLSLASLREAREREAGRLVNADNLHLPLRSGCADLVISNGVIHHTPDAKASFMELARVTRPGGTLVVSVYDRHGWYYYVWRYVGGCVRWLQRRIGDAGLRVTVFPFFHLALLIFLPLATRRRLFVPVESSWNLFHDQFTTPQCTFHTFEELRGWAREAGLDCEEERREAAHQLATVRLRSPSRA